MANDPNTIQYVIQEDGFWYIASKDRTPGVPEITVSSKGIANGLSTEYNDGYDFGPDSYNPSVTSGVPLTQTCGIHEVINYLFNQGGGKALLKKGLYNIGNAPLNVTSTSGNSQILIPYNSPANALVSIELAGENTPDFFLYQREASGGALPPLSTTNSTIIYSTLSGTGTSPAIIGADGVPTSNVSGIQDLLLSYVHMTLTNIVVRTPSNTPIKFIDFRNISGYELRNIGVETDLVDGNVVVPSVFSVGFQGGGTGGADVSSISMANAPADLNTTGTSYNDGLQHIDGFYAHGLGYPLVITEHTVADKIFLQYNVAGIIPLGGGGGAHDILIGYMDIEIQNQAFNDGALVGSQHIHVLSLDMQGLTNIIVNSTGYLAGTILLASSHVSNIALSQYTNNYSGLNILNINNALLYGLKETPSIPTNPPVSATVYQNTNPYDIRIYLPVYATTAGTAGTVAYGEDASSTVTEMTARYVNGATSSSAVDIVELVVPAGHYYEFTASGVTFGTATVKAV